MAIEIKGPAGAILGVAGLAAWFVYDFSAAAAGPRLLPVDRGAFELSGPSVVRREYAVSYVCFETEPRTRTTLEAYRLYAGSDTEAEAFVRAARPGCMVTRLTREKGVLGLTKAVIDEEAPCRTCRDEG